MRFLGSRGDKNDGCRKRSSPRLQECIKPIPWMRWLLLQGDCRSQSSFRRKQHRCCLFSLFIYFSCYLMWCFRSNLIWIVICIVLFRVKRINMNGSMKFYYKRWKLMPNFSKSDVLQNRFDPWIDNEEIYDFSWGCII